jgi:hypothetical protein
MAFPITFQWSVLSPYVCRGRLLPLKLCATFDRPARRSRRRRFGGGGSTVHPLLANCRPGGPEISARFESWQLLKAPRAPCGPTPQSKRLYIYYMYFVLCSSFFFFLLFWWRWRGLEAFTQQGRAHSTRLHPDGAAHPALMPNGLLFVFLVEEAHRPVCRELVGRGDVSWWAIRP